MTDQHKFDEHEPEIAYEAARDELVGIVQKLEAGGMGLAESLALWERGEKLANVCQQWLDGARARLDAVTAAGEDDETHEDQSPESDDNDDT